MHYGKEPPARRQATLSESGIPRTDCPQAIEASLLHLAVGDDVVDRDLAALLCGFCA